MGKRACLCRSIGIAQKQINPLTINSTRHLGLLYRLHHRDRSTHLNDRGCGYGYDCARDHVNDRGHNMIHQRYAHDYALLIPSYMHRRQQNPPAKWMT